MIRKMRKGVLLNFMTKTKLELNYLLIVLKNLKKVKLNQLVILKKPKMFMKIRKKVRQQIYYKLVI